MQLTITEYRELKQKMKQLHEYQNEFNVKFGFTYDQMDFNKLVFRHDLAREETLELLKAIHRNNEVDIVDALIDQIYIAYGTLNMLGIDIDRAFLAVHDANMKKERGVNTKRGSVDYDVIKPEGWEAPDHSDNIGILKELLYR